MCVLFGLSWAMNAEGTVEIALTFSTAPDPTDVFFITTFEDIIKGNCLPSIHAIGSVLVDTEL